MIERTVHVPADVNGPFVFRPFERGTRDTARESGPTPGKNQEATGGGGPGGRGGRPPPPPAPAGGGLTPGGGGERSEGLPGEVHLGDELGTPSGVFAVEQFLYRLMVFVVDRSERDGVREIDLAFVHLTSPPNFSSVVSIRPEFGT